MSAVSGLEIEQNKIIEGFEQQISFGYLHSDDHFLREEAKAFVEELTHIIENDSFAR